MTRKYTEILHFWFGDNFRHGIPVPNRNELWFGFNPQIDEQIKQQFGDDVLRASVGNYNSWKAAPEGRLALIILLDQLPRNIYRGKKEAFAHDEQATQLCLEGLELGHDQQLMPAHRIFFYLPLEHNESLELQRRCVELFSRLLKEVDPAIADMIKNNLAYAQQHLEIIERFGRFPHRNRALGRQSTKQELAYLKESNARFGQGG